MYSFNPWRSEVRTPIWMPLFKTAAGRASGLITITNTVLFGYRKRIAELAIKYHLPTMYRGPDWVEAGGLMSYAADDLEA